MASNCHRPAKRKGLVRGGSITKPPSCSAKISVGRLWNSTPPRFLLGAKAETDGLRGAWGRWSYREKSAKGLDSRANGLGNRRIMSNHAECLVSAHSPIKLIRDSPSTQGPAPASARTLHVPAFSP